MRQPAAAAVDQPNIPVALRVILDAIPNDRLAGLLYELARVASVIDVPEPTPLPATAGKRGPGWPKGRKRGPRKVRIAEPTVEPAAGPAAQAKSPDAKLRAKRDRANAARRARRAAAHAGNAGNGGNGKANRTHDPAVSARKGPAPAPDAASAKRTKHAHDMRARRARKAAARQANGNDKAADAAATALWAHATTLSPKEPWKPVAAQLSLNMAVCVDAWRSRNLPPGIGPAEVAKFTEPAPN